MFSVTSVYLSVCLPVSNITQKVMKGDLERAKHSFFALPSPLSYSVMNKICLNQVGIW